MADFEISFSSDILKDLLLDNSQELCFSILVDGAEVVKEEMVKELTAAGHEDSGDMIQSIKVKKPVKNKDGTYSISIVPTGNSKTKLYTEKNKKKSSVTNAAKLRWIEYGVNGRQPARPILDRIKNNVEKRAQGRMQESYQKKVKR